MIASLSIMAILFLVATLVEDRLTSAQTREDLGFSRGSIIDANGRILARTVASGDKPIRQYVQAGASSWLGFPLPGGGWRGLEATYDAVLRPVVHSSILSPLLDHLGGSPQEGDRLRLTIDSRVQSAATRALGEHRGAVVALNPRTGAILAMVSGPTCSLLDLGRPRTLRACERSPSRPLSDRAVSRVYAPGSIFKIVTISAALDTGTFHLDDVFSGAEVFGPSPYFDSTAYPSNVTRSDLTSLTLEQALAFSDNFTFAHVGLTLGSDTFLRYARRFGIGSLVPSDVAVARSTVAEGKPRLSRPELAQASFGAAVDQVTPFQMALVASAVANGGVLMRPYLIKDVETSLGVIRQHTRREEIRRVMRAGTAAEVARAMTFVVDFGSGLHAQIHGVAVAGKTGTGDSGEIQPNAWFISFAPARHPVVAVAALREYSGEGADYAAPIARRVMIAALRARGYRIPG